MVLHEHGSIVGGQFVPIALARIGDEAAHLGVVLGAVGHEGELVCGVELDQATRRWLLVEQLHPAIIGPVVLFDRQDPLDKVLAQRHIVQATLLLQRQQGEAVHDLAGEHAGAISLCHSMLIIHFHTE
jgi:hypothetical protein